MNLTLESTTLPLWLERAIVAVLSVAFAATFGLNFGVGNQTCYLVPSLRLLRPELLANDWYAMQTTHYHPFYGYLGAALLWLDPNGWAIGLALTILVTLGAVSLYLLVRATAGERLALPAFVLLVTLAWLTRTRGPLDTYVFDAIFQPSTLASAFFVASVPAFVRARFVLSGFLLAASVLSHVNIALLVISAFGFAHLLLGRERLVPRLAQQLAVPVLVMLGFLPLMASAAKVAPGTEWARNLYLYVRAPHHYALVEHAREFLPLVSWQLIAFGAAWPFRKEPWFAPLGRLVALCLGLCVVIGAGVAGALVSSSFAVIFSWRLVGHAELLLAAVAVTALVRSLSGIDPEPARSRFAPLVVGAGFLLGLWAYGVRGRLGKALLVVVAFALVVALARRLVRNGRGDSRSRFRAFERATPKRLALGGGLLLFAVGSHALSRIGERSNLIRGLPRDEAALYAWMRTKTPRDALFVTPPEMDRFRLLGERPIVVDWKAMPTVSREVIEWYRRIEAVTGRQGLRGQADLAGYATLDPARLETLRRRYGVNYAVVQRGHAAALGAYPRVFENASFVVVAAVPRFAG